MNKQELIAAMIAKTGDTKANTEKALSAFLECIEEALSRDEEVKLVGFGSFSAVLKAASEGRDPRTNQPIEIPASKRIKFKAGKQLKESVNSTAVRKQGKTAKQTA